MQRLRLTWPGLHYSASLLVALDSALSIYPAERPQSVAQMRARLDSGSVSVAPALNDAASSLPAPAIEPAPPVRVAQDLDAVMAFVPDPDPVTTSVVARIEDDPSVRTEIARQVRNSRRIAMWSGAVLVLLALLLIGMQEFRPEHLVGRVLDVLGVSRGTGAGDNAAVSASAVGPAAPMTPPMVAEPGPADPMPTEPTAADSPAGATAPAAPANAPIAADAGPAKPMPTEPIAADSTAGDTARASPASAPVAADAEAAATAAPAAVARPPASTPPPTRVAQQQASRAPASPREVCGERTQFSLYRCMQTQCSQRRWTSHAQCERLRATDSVD